MAALNPEEKVVPFGYRLSRDARVPLFPYSSADCADTDDEVLRRTQNVAEWPGAVAILKSKTYCLPRASSIHAVAKLGKNGEIEK